MRRTTRGGASVDRRAGGEEEVDDRSGGADDQRADHAGENRASAADGRREVAGLRPGEPGRTADDNGSGARQQADEDQPVEQVLKGGAAREAGRVWMRAHAGG